MSEPYEWAETIDEETIVNRIVDVPEARCDLVAVYKNLSCGDADFEPVIESWDKVPWDAQCFMRSMAREILRYNPPLELAAEKGGAE